LHRIAPNCAAAARTHRNASSIAPPLQPSCGAPLSQSINCSSESEVETPRSTNSDASIAPVAANDQHEPHVPWSLTGDTAPAAAQSTADGSVACDLGTCWRRAPPSSAADATKPLRREASDARSWSE
jgi:hypothetical protein